MRRFTYHSGEEVKSGDHITYHGQPGVIEFLVTGKTGDPAMDWYLENNPRGGFMIRAADFGNVFLTDSDTDEDLDFVSRADQ